MKFKNYIETGSGIKDTSTSPGTAGQVLSSTVTGTSWIDPDTLEAAASKLVVISCKNVSGAQILKGTPVYQSGTVGATDVIEVEPADATISTGYLPAIGILQTTLNNNGFGNVVITGEFLNYSTADIPTDRPGGDPFTGDTVYLAAGGGLTCIKPTGAGNAIQNMGLIGKVSGGNSGSITVSSIMRANDVPNLPEGRIWIGDGNTIVSDTVYVDEPNNSLIVNGTTLQTTESLSVIGSGYFSDKISIGTAASTTPINNSYTMNLLDLNSAIAFGDNSQTTQNVIVGEYGSTDTDQLWLHGKNGTIFSHDGDVNEAISIAGVINNVGNFGIGTTNPAFKLDVANGGIGVPRDSTGITFVNFSTLGSSIKSNTSSDLIFNTRLGSSPYTESERMRILNNGNVGIGTTSPNYMLHLGGNTVGAVNGQLAFGDVVNVPSGLIQGYRVDGSYKGELRFLTSTSGGTVTQRMVIDEDGNVGIGTTSPGATLTVDGNVFINAIDSIPNRTEEFQVTGTQIITNTGTNSASLFLGYNSSGACTVQLGRGRTANGLAYIDLNGEVMAAGDYGFRILRGSGPNAQTWIRQVGTGNLTIDAVNGADTVFTNTNVGINTTNPLAKLHVLGTTSSTPALGAAASAAQIGSSTYGTLFSTLTSGRGVIQQGRSDGVTSSYDLLLQPAGGNVGIGANSASSKLYIQGSTSTTSSQLMRIKSTSIFYYAPGRMIEFIRSNGAVRGYISMNQYGVQYNTSSDYRLKENITPINDAVSRLKELKPSRFSWKEGPSDYKVDGFIAHELAEVMPEAVSGEKDAVDENNKPSYQGIDQAKIVPLLTAVLQEAMLKIEQLEARIQKLENK